MSQLRLNPLTGRWVTIVADRAERPTDFAPRVAQVEADPGRPCPFCPGHEEDTPPALETVSESGEWQVRVVPNRYPAFAGDEPFTVRTTGPVHTEAEASGIHEVLVYSRDHHATLATLTDQQVGNVMDVLRRRFIEHAEAPGVRYTQAIVNHGRESGASLAHPHGQLLGMPFVPGELLDEERAFGRFHGGCILCATVEAEIADPVRVVLADEDCVVVSPYWAGSPYELLVIPRHHAVHLQDDTAETVAAVGRRLRDAIKALNAKLGDVAFNLVLHTAPHQHQGPFHWHIHIWPKMVTVAGFERGTGVMINIVSPEDAAAELRSVLPAFV
jgi:UDPglucose--hexose-1-phosphate uridylyltransferase